MNFSGAADWTATVEAQKPTNNVPQNAVIRDSLLVARGSPFTNHELRTTSHEPQTTVIDADIARGYALVEVDDNAAAIDVPTNAVTVGNWHLHGARSSIGGWQGLAAMPNGAPQC